MVFGYTSPDDHFVVYDDEGRVLATVGEPFSVPDGLPEAVAESLGRLDLKGKSEPIEVFRLVSLNPRR